MADRADPFEDIWDEIRENLKANPGFEAKTLFDDLQLGFPFEALTAALAASTMSFSLLLLELPVCMATEFVRD